VTDWPPLHDYSHSRAVVMGTWNYSFLTPVPAARNSWRRIVSVLTGPLCGWPRDRLLLLDNRRYPGNLPDQLVTAFEDATDIALFYYVGHGQIDSDDQLSMGLTESRTEPNRRAATSLQFSAVRRALLDSGAATKIVILDCCFAALASRPASTLAGLSGDVLDMAAGTGAYTMAATSPYATAWYETSRSVRLPQTYFTRYLVDLIERGIPGQPAGLRLQPLFTHLREALAADKRPVPASRSVDAARDFVFAYNAAPPEAQRDPERELSRMTQRLAEAEASKAAAEARVQALRAEAAARTKDLQRLQEQAQRLQTMTARQQRDLEAAIEAATENLEETIGQVSMAAAAAPDISNTAQAPGEDTDPEERGQSPSWQKSGPRRLVGAS